MIKSQRLLKVPKDVKLRNLLRHAANAEVTERQLQPPMGFEQLETLAEELLEKQNVDREYLDFTIVLCGNALWRDVIAATPFDRRLLLLPQCLKNTQSCQGEMDSLGLICAGCKGCQIDSVLSKAEALGYTTLVAEGTTVAVGLVEEGAIDAVIGVSCMPVLQRSFGPVSRAAVPVMGLPLLYDGCENTNVDYGWLFEEMHQYRPHPDKEPLSVSLLKDHVEDYFTTSTLKNYFKGKDETEHLAVRMLEIGGQRIRPLLTVLAYRSYTDQPNEEVQQLMAIIIECFHKASLIHDDIEDDDDYRYEQETLHRTNGIPVAINVGDFLIGKGYQLLAALKVEPVLIAESLKVVAESHLNLSRGQGDDLAMNKDLFRFSVDEVLHIFTQKTGEAVKVALLLGAIQGGAPQCDLAVLAQFADWFGIAYQIRDDLNEFHSEQVQEHAHHFPFLLALLKERLRENGGSDMIDSVGPDNFSQLCAIIRKEQVDLHADAFQKLYVDKCFRELDKLQNLKLRLSLYGVLGKIF
ncbi:polyprenyl synthetase family protein [Mangrovibacterium lignilyticum]|uniref:polyprenyl synthetase family protein n=1 Tax=Mangrovibacterium lignilyticum TaxID=2668052 RepID=UPI0013D733F6|nr:polyprenyl synthetase family protein [Mangrovibacterium lignilyticum]